MDLDYNLSPPPSNVPGQERAELRKWVTKNEEIRMHL